MMTSEILQPLLDIFRLNTRLFRNCLESVDDTLACRRPEGGGNSLGFLAVHLIDARCFLGRYVGHPMASPLAPEWDAARGIEDAPPLPNVSELLDYWRRCADDLENGWANVDPAILGAESDPRFPVKGTSVLSGIAFLLQHESYHIGQMALLRRILGLHPMSYD